MRGRYLLGTALICLALSAPGCARSPRVNFYTLEPVAPAGAPAAGQGAPSVVVGPVTLPEAVDRPQLVVRAGANRVEILETHRWAEPLKSEIPRLVAQNLGRLLGSDRVHSYQQQSGAGAGYRVLLDVVRLEAEPGQGVTIETAWTVRRTPGGNPRTGRTLWREKAEGGGYDPLVPALSRALAGVSADIAKALQAEAAAQQVQ
jgi:uncharacterized protein